MSINSANLSCPSCKATNPAHARFCQNCGKSMFADADTVNQSVSDQTGRPMAADFVYAGFWKRVFAYWIDAIVFGLLFSVIAVLSFIGKTSFTPDDAEQLALFYASFYLGWWMYFALMESSSGQATIGKRAIGIKVTDMQGQGLSFMHAAGRQLSGVVSSLTFTIGYLLAAFSGRK